MTHIYTHYSPELRTIASVTNKYSDNMYAENILRTMGKVLGEGDGTYDSRRVELAVLDSIAPGVETINLRDGSGLSPNDGSGILTESILYQPQITLNHNHSIITVNFSLSNYVSVLKNRIYYKLEGFEAHLPQVG